MLTGCIPHTRHNSKGITQQVNNTDSRIDEQIEAPKLLIQLATQGQSWDSTPV